MELMGDGLIAFLAAVGVSTILWLLAEALFRWRAHPPAAAYLVEASGGAEQLDMTLRELARERPLQVILVDSGLNEMGRQRAELLLTRYGGTLVTPQQLAAMYAKENEQEE